MLSNVFIISCCIYLSNSIELNRKLLSSWYPDYATRSDLPLDNRNITSISLETFQNLKNLLTLDLSVNQLTRIEIGTFANLTNLLDLNLSRNNLAYLDDLLFKDLKSLEQFYLMDNRLVKIGLSTFNGLGNLKELDLSQNLIESINGFAFYDLQSLEYLTLNGNNLNKLDALMFTARGVNLKGLYVANNSITSITITVKLFKVNLKNDFLVLNNSLQFLMILSYFH